MYLIKRNAQNFADPFNLLADLQEDFNRIFSGSLRRVRDQEAFPGYFAPDIELSEDANQYVLRADLPGVTKDEVTLNFTGNVLEIKGSRKVEKERKEKGVYHSECRYGSFQRTIEFPSEVQSDKAKALYKDGVLEITVPKSENAKPKQIQIEVK